MRNILLWIRGVLGVDRRWCERDLFRRQPYWRGRVDRFDGVWQWSLVRDRNDGTNSWAGARVSGKHAAWLALRRELEASDAR